MYFEYRDLAHFLLALKACGLQICSRGLLYDSALLDHYEQQFLLGYFPQQPIPLDQIRLYESLLLFERSSALVYRHQECTGLRRLAKGGQRWLWNSYHWRCLDRLVRGLTANHSSC